MDGSWIFYRPRDPHTGKADFTSGKDPCSGHPKGFLRFERGRCEVSLSGADAEKMKAFIDAGTFPLGTMYHLAEPGEVVEMGGPTVVSSMTTGPAKTPAGREPGEVWVGMKRAQQIAGATPAQIKAAVEASDVSILVEPASGKTPERTFYKAEDLARMKGKA